MDTAANCKYYVTKLLGISPPKPNCVYDVRSGNVRNNREQKSLFRVFYRSNDRRRKQRHKANIQESYVPSMHADEVGAKIGDGSVLEEDTVEDIEKKFQGFRNVFEKCKVKKKNKPRLFNVSTGLRFTLVANSMLIDNEKKANETKANDTVINSEKDTIEEDYAEEEEEEGNNVDDENDNNEKSDIACKDIATAQKEAVVNDLNEDAFSESKCPKDVADKVNSWIDSSVKQTADVYSEEESLFIDDEVSFYDFNKHPPNEGHKKNIIVIV